MLRRNTKIKFIGALMVAICFLLEGCSRSEETPTDNPADSSTAQITDLSDFDSQGIAELDYVEPGSTHELVYALHAPEDAAISDLRIESDCPCVRAVDLPSEIIADCFHSVRIRFKAPHKTLIYRQDLAIHGKVDGEHVETRLTIKARIGLPVQVTPEEIRLEPGAETAEVRLSNDGGEPVGFIYALSDHSEVKAVAPTTPLEPGPENALTLTVQVQPGWTGPRPARLQIKTTSNAQPELELWVYPPE